MTPAALKVTRIKPTRGWQPVDVKELWAFRDLLWVLARRELKVRYAQTVLGVAWAVIQPLMTMVVFTVIFGRWAKFPSGNVPYPVFVYAALLPWVFFSTTVTAASGSILSASSMITKVYFPRMVVPLSSAASGLADFAFSLAVMFALMFFYSVGFSFRILWLPAFVGMAVIASLGVGTLFAALVMMYRDLRFVVPFVVQIWMYVTPVVYLPDLAPAGVRRLLFLNPMTGVVEGFRFCLLGRPLDPAGTALSAAAAGVFLVTGAVYFRQVEKQFADIL